MAVANLGSGCAIETSNLQVGTMELGVLFFGDKYRHSKGLPNNREHLDLNMTISRSSAQEL